MSINYSPELVKLLMDERLHEARRSRMAHCCEELLAEEPRDSLVDRVRTLFGRQSPTTCGC